MTKNKAKELAIGIDLVFTANDFIDKLYDSLENQKCENCKWYKNAEVFDIGDYRDVCTHSTIDKFVSCPPKDFSCNQWKANADRSY